MGLHIVWTPQPHNSLNLLHLLQPTFCFFQKYMIHFSKWCSVYVMFKRLGWIWRRHTHPFVYSHPSIPLTTPRLGPIALDTLSTCPGDPYVICFTSACPADIFTMTSSNMTAMSTVWQHDYGVNIKNDRPCWPCSLQLVVWLLFVGRVDYIIYQNCSRSLNKSIVEAIFGWFEASLKAGQA